MREYKDITHIAIEKNVYSGADVIKLQELISKDKELCNRRLTFINEHRTKNKFNRIDTCVGAVNLGQVIFCEDDEEAIEQLKEYCGEFSIHDDFPDALADVVQRLLEIKTTQYLKFDTGFYF